MATLRFLLNDAVSKFEAAKIDNARGEAEQLLCHAFNTDRLHMQLSLNMEAGYGTPVAMFEIYCEQRLEGRPLQYILGTAQFLDLELDVDERALIPRPETEELAAIAIEYIRSHDHISALDLCTGSGCLALALADAGADVTATDLSEQALSLARHNAEKLGLEAAFLLGDLYQALPPDASFDLIVTNPPYIPTAVCETLQPEVRSFEPRLALDGGPDGLALIRTILEGLGPRLNPGGLFLMEIGHDQAEEALKLCPGAEIIQDLEGHDRILKYLKK